MIITINIKEQNQLNHDNLNNYKIIKPRQLKLIKIKQNKKKHKLLEKKMKM